VFQAGSARWQCCARDHLPQKPGTVDKGSDSNNPIGKLARFHIDAGQSTVSARVFVGGLLAAFGHDHTVSVRGVRGEVEITPITIEPASVHIVIDARSASEVGKEFSEREREKVNHSIQDEALQTSRFPEIAFKSTKISITKTGESQCTAKIAGELTLHGIMRPMEVPADVIFREHGLTAQGDFKIRHSDFAIRQLSAAAGAVKAKDGIVINYKIVASAD